MPVESGDGVSKESRVVLLGGNTGDLQPRFETVGALCRDHLQCLQGASIILRILLHFKKRVATEQIVGVQVHGLRQVVDGSGRIALLVGDKSQQA